MVVGVGLLAYVGGLISANANLAPFQMVKEADRAASDWRQNWRSYLGIRAMYLKPASRNSASGVTVNDPGASPGYTFVTTMFADGFYPALLDMEGKVVHRWKIAYSDAFPDPPQLDYDVDDLDTVVHGAEVFPDGSVLLNWSGYGLAKLDRCAKVEWSIPRITHHAVDMLPNGEILTLSRTFATEKDFRPGMTMPDRGYIWRDEIMRISADGKILEDGADLGPLLQQRPRGAAVADHDPVHPVAERGRSSPHQRHRGAEGGDGAGVPDVHGRRRDPLLRGINMLMVIDSASRR